MGKTIRFNENGLIALKKKLNEIMVGTPGVSHNDVFANVKLYHGTDITALVTILKTNRMCASEGRQHGETHGLNWFTLKNDGTSYRGAILSIEIPESELDTVLQKMNNAHFISRKSCFDISKYNPKVERFCDHTRETLNNYYRIVTEKGERYPIERMRDDIFYDWCERSGNEETFMEVSDYDFGIIMANVLGEDAVRKEGFIDEEVGEEFAPVGKIGGEEKNGDVLAGGNYFHMEQVEENVEKEVESSEVDLSSFKKRDSLPPGIWKDEETLSSKVRLKLLDIADDFWEFVNLTWVEPKGIIITGSICNFNWSKFSDIDLHLIVDFSEIDNKTEFVKQYLDSKKNEWNTEHEGLKIMGFPVELYVQDVNENPEAGGIYDLEENAWIKRPNPHAIKSIGLNKFNIKDKAAEIMTIIDDMYKVLDTATDGHVIDKIGEDAGYLWKKVKDLRKKSLNKNGENGAGNIVYKVLRRTGYLDRLFKLSTKVYDRTNSITESKEILNEFLDSNYGMPLYKYFQWAEKASDREKVEDLFYHCPYIIGKYLSDVSGYDVELSDLEDELENDSDLEYDDEYIESVLDALEKHKLLRKLLEYPYIYAYAEELPAWFFMDFIRVVKNEWCIHFTGDANNIARKGFTGGTPEVEDIAYTNAGREKHSAGYDFAFLIDDSSVDFNGYGDEAVIFRASGVLLLHYGDEQRQVVFWGPSVKELIPIKKDDYSSDWVIEGLNGQIFATGKPSELADWATDNLPQYRNQILAGKSGYRPWGYSRPAFDNEFMKLPLNNESVKKYLTLLKEEVALDGSTEDNPYEKRWKAEREALKNFVANYGKLMQSREDNKMGRLYKVYYDETMSNLIGYNYCICVQWDELTMKPKSTVYIRALDKFTPFIRRNLQFDTRGRDNMRGTYDDTGY